MTVSAWIKSTSYPVDDTAIVSSHNTAVAGYQLDTTIDKGPRTIGFKIADECGRLAVRYGATHAVGRDLVSRCWRLQILRRAPWSSI